MRKSTEKGSVLISVLIMVVIVMLIMGAVASFITGGIQRTKATSARLQALYLAEAGVDKAIEQLKEDWDTTFPTPWPSSSPTPTPSYYSPFPSGDEVVGGTAFIIPPDGGSDGRLIAGYGKVEIPGRTVIEKVEVKVLKTPEEPSGGGGGDEGGGGGGGGLPAFNYALFAGNKITIGNTPGIVGNVVANTTKAGSVEFIGDTKIVGNLYIGSEANPDVEPGNIIKIPDWLPLEKCFGDVEPGKKGKVDNLDETITYPTPEFPNYPTGLSNRGNLTLDNGVTATISADGYYKKINIAGGSKLYIDTGSDPNGERIILVDESFSLSNNGEVILNGSGKLKLYVKKTFQAGGGATFNYVGGKGDPSRVTLYYGGEDTFNLSNNVKLNGTVVVSNAAGTVPVNNPAAVTIGGSGALTGSLIYGGDKKIIVRDDLNSMSGLIYAPNAKVTLTASGGIKGAVVCKDFEAVNGQVLLSYDESVRNIEIPDDVFPPSEGSGDEGGGGGGESGGGVIYISSWHSEPSQER